MSAFDRRGFLKHGVWGLAAAGTAGLTLKANALETPATDDHHEYLAFLENDAAPTAARKTDAASTAPWGTIPEPSLPQRMAATEDNILGPYHRPGAPFRGKITPVLEPGTPMVIRGRVWGLDAKKPLPGAVLDVWQANAAGRYDNDDPKNPPAKGVFVNRARLTTDETGYYEFETIHPGRYQIGPNAWRPSHVHYLVQHPGYRRLITQLYFEGDPMNAQDRFIKPSLTISLVKVMVQGQAVELGTFDIVLAPA